MSSVKGDKGKMSVKARMHMTKAKQYLTPYYQGLKDYSEITTINGVVYVFADDKFNWISRLFWFVVGWVLIVCSVLLIDKAWDDWQEKPILTTIKTTGYPIGRLDYPAITICGLGMVDSVLEDALLRQVQTYITNKTSAAANLTLGANSTYRDLFPQNHLNYSDFIDEKYPGLPYDMNLTDVIPLLSSPEPDPFLLSKLAVAGQYVQSQDILKDSQGPCDGEGYDYDPIGSVCYRIADPNTGISDDVEDLCSLDGEDLFTVQSDVQMSGLAEIIADESSGLSMLSNQDNAFLTSAIRNPDTEEIWINPWTEFSPSSTGSPKNLPSLNITSPLDNTTNNCFTLTYKLDDNDEAQFVVNAIDCDQPSIIVCYKQASVEQNFTTPSINTSYTLLDKLLNSNLWEEMQETTKTMQNDFQTAFKKLDLVKAYESLFEVLWYSQLPCFESSDNPTSSRAMLKRCEWRGKPISCAKIFNTFPTDRGMCCAFNIEAAENTFQESQYQSMVTTMQQRDRKMLGVDDIFGANYSRPVPRAGTNKGLTVVLDAHTDLLSPGSVTEDYQGFAALIGSYQAYPLLNQNHIRIRPGYENIVGILVSDVLSQDEIMNIDPQKRYCYFDNEYGLHLHKNYSQENCLLECELSYALNRTAYYNSEDPHFENSTLAPFCVPWFLPKSDAANTTICDPWKAKIFYEEMVDVPDDLCDEICLPDCTYTEYDFVVTTVPFRPCNEQNVGVSSFCNVGETDGILDPSIFADEIRNEYDDNQVPSYASMPSNIRVYNNNSAGAIFKKLVGKTYDAYEVDIATVNFYFTSSNVVQIDRSLAMSWVDFVGLVGGFLGLCNGFSLCSAVEILFWVAHLYINVKKSRDAPVDQGKVLADKNILQMTQTQAWMRSLAGARVE